jgi:hypothetical protein
VIGSSLKIWKKLKKVIHAHVKAGEPVGARAGKTMGFDCIKLIYG